MAFSPIACYFLSYDIEVVVFASSTLFLHFPLLMELRRSSVFLATISHVIVMIGSRVGLSAACLQSSESNCVNIVYGREGFCFWLDCLCLECVCWCGRPPKLSCRVGNDVDVVLLLVESTSSSVSTAATTNTAWPLLQYNSGSERGGRESWRLLRCTVIYFSKCYEITYSAFQKKTPNFMM